METGEILWSSEAQGWGEPSANRPVFYKDLIIIGAVWRRMYALDINTGREVWELLPTISSFFYSTPLVCENRLIVPAGNGIYVLNPSNGAVRREITGCGMHLMHAGSGAGDTAVQKKACFDTSACPVLAGDELYIGTVNNGVLALNAGLSWPAAACSGAAIACRAMASCKIRKPVRIHAVLAEQRSDAASGAAASPSWGVS